MTYRQAQMEAAAEFLALYADDARPPNALSYEIVRCKKEVLIALAYGEFSEGGVEVPAGLSELAYNEMERRDNALQDLLADPAMCGALS